MVETLSIQLMRKVGLTLKQMQLVVGSLLGDAYLVKTTRGFAFRVNHGLRQRDYVDWKYNLLENLVNSSPRSSGNCYYFRTVSHPVFAELQGKFYANGRRVLPAAFVGKYLAPLTLAVWIMDDGTKCGNQLRINSQCFSVEENRILQELLSAKLGIKTVLNKDKDMVRLRVLNESMPRLITLAKPYIIPSMLYKLPP